MKVLLFKDQNGYSTLLFSDEKKLKAHVLEIINEEIKERELDFDPEEYDDDVAGMVEAFEEERGDNNERMYVLEGVMAG